IFWEPQSYATFVEEDLRERAVPTAIALAHEMFHAYDAVRGLLDRRFVEHAELEFIPLAEYRASYFENVLRKNMGHKYRKFYGNSANRESSVDLLNKEGKPIFLPTPCISWL